jgi:indolepyruvate ferredoxin oxidoreductase beta subunit
LNKNIILAGVGGQGLLSIAAVIAEAALRTRLFIAQSEVHGMAQRGGEVQSHVRLSDRKIYSNLIRKGACDIILATEPLEALRYIEYLNNSAVLITNRIPLKNINNYPDEAEIERSLMKVQHHLLLDAAALAKEAGSSLCANMVVLGAGSPFIGLDESALRDAIENIFARKGEKIVATNLAGFAMGRKAALDGSV